MGSRFLPFIVSNASFVLNGTAPLLMSRSADRHRALAFCAQYRRRGIALLLQKGQGLLLHRDLQRSGAAYAAFLQWTDEQGRVASKAAPFFDAVACGDAVAAASIAKQTATSVQPDEEYEDDFLCMRWLMGRFYLRQDPGALAALLRRYEVVLDGAEDPRFLICQALQNGDASLFDGSLQALIDTREADYAAGIEAENIPEEEWATEGKIYVEGLALLRLAASLGLAVQADYRFIPSLAIGTQATSVDATAWSNPDAP